MRRSLTIAVVTVLALAVSACAAAATPTATPLPAPSATPGPVFVTGPKPEPTRVEFEASDGQILVGTYYPARVENAPAVVLIHWGRGDRQDWAAVGMADWLQNWPGASGSSALLAPAEQKIEKYPFTPLPEGMSFAVFTVDYRGYGESVRTPKTTKGNEGWILDAKAAYAKARTLPGVDPDRVAGIGASVGADGVADGCEEGCRGALSIAAGNYLGMYYSDAVKALDEAGKPAWCIVAENDGEAAPVCKAVSGKNYKLVLYPSGGHAMQLFDSKLELDPPIDQVILEFLTLVFKD